MAVTQAQLRRGILTEVYSAGITTRPYQTPMQTAGINTTATTIDVVDGDAWTVGDIGEFDDGEQFFVTAISTNALTVTRGWNETTAAAQDQYDAITQNPRFTIQQVDQALEHVYQDYQPDVYDTHIVTFTKSATTRWYDFDDTGEDQIIDVLSVYYKPTDVSYPVGISDWDFRTGLDTSTFGAYSGLLLGDSLNIPDATSIFVVTKKAIFEAANLPDYLKSCTIFGGVYFLLGSGNVARTHDPGKRTDRTVQPGQEARDSYWYWQEYNRRKNDFAGELVINVDKMPGSERNHKRARRYRP